MDGKLVDIGPSNHCLKKCLNSAIWNKNLKKGMQVKTSPVSFLRFDTIKYDSNFGFG